jgi:succinate dehydrogenase / fumarate reductase cytochrome b subunit
LQTTQGFFEPAMPVKHARPTSPHLQIYKLPLTAIVSISHRITGTFLISGLLLVLWLLYSLLQGRQDFQDLQVIMQSWLFTIFLFGFMFALFFHLCHGVRHLIWDIGNSFDPGSLYKYAVVELVGALVLTLLAMIYL